MPPHVSYATKKLTSDAGLAANTALDASEPLWWAPCNSLRWILFRVSSWYVDDTRGLRIRFLAELLDMNVAGSWCEQFKEDREWLLFEMSEAHARVPWKKSCPAVLLIILPSGGWNLT